MLQTFQSSTSPAWGNAGRLAGAELDAGGLRVGTAPLGPVDHGRTASAQDAAMRAGGAGRSPAETRAIGEAFRQALDRAPASLPHAAPLAQANYAELKRAGEHALLASDVYSDASNPALLPRGYEALGDADAEARFPGFTARDDQAGFYSRVYLDRNSQTYVVVNRGTNDASAPIGILRRTPDGKTNGALITGGTTRQANLALANAREVTAGSDGRVRFAGHSLGGALASLQAMRTGKEAIVFNPLGINVRTAERYHLDMGRVNDVRSYQVAGEPVARANRVLGLQSSARTTQLDSRELSWSANEGFRSSAGANDAHSMTAVIGGLLHGMVDAKGR